MSSVKELVLLPYNEWERLKKVNTVANTIGAEEIEIMTRERPEESVKKREEEIPEAMSLPEKKNEDSEIKENIPTAAPPTPSPLERKGEGEVPDTYVEQEDNGNRTTVTQVEEQAGIW